MLKIIVNLFYSPVQKLRTILESHKDVYIPINGGSSLLADKWANNNVIYDNIGDNISNKNKIFNEMTSIYWVWKHYNEIGNPEYIGFNHYRRFFKYTDIQDYKNYDLIVSKPIFSSKTISLIQQYNYYHKSEDLLKCFEILKTKHKDFYESFFNYMNTTGVNYAPCNMFIMTRELFFEWCIFIFPVLFQLEDKIDLEGRDNYQKRALCFLTERIFGFWCYQKGLLYSRVKEVQIEEFLDFKPAKINERGDFS